MPDNNLTNVTWTEIQVPEPILGEGWSGTGPYHHAPVSSYPLSYPYSFKANHAYEITVKSTNTVITEGIGIAFAKNALDTNGNGSAFGFIHHPDTTLVIFTKESFSHMNISGRSIWEGTAQVTKIRETKICENFISKESSIYLGGGGTASSGTYNTAVGDVSLYNNSTGSGNTAVGSSSLKSTTTGESNTAIGQDVMRSNTSGSNNVAVGAKALEYNGPSSGNTAVGAEALRINAIGSYNTAIGGRSLYHNLSTYNTAIGSYSLYHNTTGANNTATGSNSLSSNQTGSGNTANGHEALRRNTVGNQNTAVGISALYSNTTGGGNTAAGANSLYSNTEGSGNTAIGTVSLAENTIGNSNTAMGFDSLWQNTNGDENSAYGCESMSFNISGSRNTTNGAYSLYENVSGCDNTALGYNALRFNDGECNTAVGAEVLVYNSTGQRNTATGYRSLYRNDSGTANAAFGDQSLHYNTEGGGNAATGCAALMSNKTGANNTANGACSLMSNVTGSLNTASGFFAGKNGSYDNSVYIGAHSQGTDGSTNETAIGYGAVGNGSNTITLGNSDIERLYCNTTAITALSDRRIKEEIEDADLDRCLDTVKQLKVSRYKYKDFVGKHNDKHVTGFLADDVEKVFPKSVSKNDKAFPVLDEEGKPVYEIMPETEETKNLPEEARRRPKTFVMEDVKDITMTEAVPTLWGAMQALLEQNEQLLQRVNALENEWKQTQ